MTAVRLRVLMEPRHGARYEEILALALATEEAGFDAFFRSDHLMGVDPNDPDYRPTECWTTLGGLARDTSRVRLGALVTAATFREPGLLAAIVASVDEMSGGRAELGLGTGWYEREHHAFGIPFPPRRERFDRMEEQLAVITGLWAGPGFSFAGTHYRVADNRTPPRPTQSPHPPVIVGGSGPRRTPAIAARYATEFNAALTLGGGAAALRERFANFARACEAIGRDPAGARRSAVLPVACGATPAETERRAAVIGSDLMRSNAAIGSPAEVTERIGELAEAGADTVYLHVYDIHDLDHIALIGAEVLPHVAPTRTGAPA
ncbi:TIGR03560 family F420-dependent LLM class oxidoreductase [Pseudonocardia adelaidensis]|uniref:LLM class F420-dependent oxidoreductase n=1 Tax=Pseudonocardia adelaidensis TaxID=648754 RepID=A0ABP9P536_9PSEU